ncbi:flagellar basal body-associated FliL family protein [Hyphococcus sp.]|uniref:flagellar basal body-associated FliL family protein n=1 Tax=Hyphococcus sp. TaxID=2038636 RepID=UPI003CCBCC4A
MADKEKAAEEAPENGEDAEQPRRKGLGLIPMIIGAVAAAGAAAGAAFVLAPAPGGDAPEHASADGAHEGEAGKENHDGAKGHDEKKAGKEKKKKKKKGGHGKKGGEGDVKAIGQIQHSEYATFLVLDPIIVSIQPIGRSKHLKISLVLETGEEDAAMLLENGFYVKDVLNTFLRSVDASVLEDPAAMSRLRAQILRRIRAIVPGAHVENVLITEFVLT